MLMPEISRGGGRMAMATMAVENGARESVEISITIATKNHTTGLQVLHRETKGVKLNSARIIESKFANGKQITNKMRNMKNIVEFERVAGGRGKSDMTGRRNRDITVVSDGNKVWRREGYRARKITIIIGDVRGGPRVHDPAALLKGEAIQRRDERRVVPCWCRGR
jgi:hypothetical protein